MSLSSTERSAINRKNAQHATGPKTQAGKNRSKLNAVTHGLTSRQLTLPGEDPEVIQAQLDDWNHACQPQSPDESALVEQAALGMIRLHRCATAETALIAEQVRHAERHWDHTRAVRLLELTRALASDPARAVLELRTFAAGAGYLLGRWRVIQGIFQRRRKIENIELIGEMMRLMGQDPTAAVPPPTDVYDFMLALLASGPPGLNPKDPEFLEFAQEFMPPDVAADHGLRPLDQSSARRHVDTCLAMRISELERLEAKLQAIDSESRAQAKDRAMRPSDTSENRLFLRYMKSSETGFDRAVKTLAKLQESRAKREEAAVRNEPKRQVESTSSDVEIGSYVASSTKERVVNEAVRPVLESPGVPVSAVAGQTLRVVPVATSARHDE